MDRSGITKLPRTWKDRLAIVGPSSPRPASYPSGSVRDLVGEHRRVDHLAAIRPDALVSQKASLPQRQQPRDYSGALRILRLWSVVLLLLSTLAAISVIAQDHVSGIDFARP
jgi:hypothetical protein